MYCPVCFNDSMILNKKGIIHIVINKKQMDNGRFLYDISNGDEKDSKEKLKQKIEEFFKWYTKFLNKESIQYLELASSSFSCVKGCRLDASFRLSVVDVFISKKEIIDIVRELAPKYELNVEIK